MRANRPAVFMVATAARRPPMSTTRCRSLSSVTGRVSGVELALGVEDVVEVEVARAGVGRGSVQDDFQGVQHFEDEPDLGGGLARLQIRQPAPTDVGRRAEVGLGHSQMMTPISDIQSKI